MNDSNIQKFSTRSIHSGHDVQATAGTRAVPIYQSTSYVFHDCDHAANLFNLSEPGYIYTRLNNPTTDILEKRMADLEGGIGALCTSSGMSAISTTILTLLKSGDHIVASNSLYGGTFNLFNVTLPRFGISTTFVDASNPESFKNATRVNTKAYFLESLGNPKLDIPDIKKIADVAKGLAIPFIVDNTVATPYLLRPIEHGANIVIHSLTKYINGNGTSIGGIIIDAGTFDWSNEKFPEFNEPSPGYHGLVYNEQIGQAAFIAKARLEGLRDFGAALSPFNAFQILQGLETLGIRVKRHSENSLALAKWLETQEEVQWANYPGLESSPYFELASEYMPEGQSGIVTFGVKGGFDAAKIVVNGTKLFSLLVNIGDTKSLIVHPASTTHQQLKKEEQELAGVTEDMIRLSVGLEDVEDLKKDLRQAFDLVNH
ncbi:O-acetylhomoserine/O-acetylserine sulfhydrylase [Allomuricauda ruestringensis DSM 13258]|uniref:O-acetylhomoserine/O-acetylserine sulfhydrylase n=1 Tax=Allomuricauda ruestringensis (strain DSM 13258 / CIP 107369 / LMG 19739 / B1) TaxID=886377 RepID=G2PQL9_ALLRU|nr:O-acetylhomoserine aminocarboxypropyltransferase/cysteine synthase family protein [Allomuricauda ruestringensis]AEM71656.1 O-acetylhomoserine/O-acetylserine sulfhydrylase [Allomuricauda ruestringensis DSM 13258]